MVNRVTRIQKGRGGGSDASADRVAFRPASGCGGFEQNRHGEAEGKEKTPKLENTRLWKL